MDAIRHQNSLARARGFSLIELLVTIAVVAAISSMMFPAFGKVRQAALGLMCQNNMRSIYMALEQFRGDNPSNKLPDSVYAPREGSSPKPLRPQELMALTGDERDPRTGRYKWDGLGALFGVDGKPRCVTDPRVFYCPAHGSVHTYERYAEALQGRTNTYANSTEKVYGNYHYWDAWNRAAAERQKSSKGQRIHPIAQNVILTDGMRTQQDFSHRYGCNTLNLDGSVVWIGGGRLERAIASLPATDTEVKPYDRQVALFEKIVAAIETTR